MQANFEELIRNKPSQAIERIDKWNRKIHQIIIKYTRADPQLVHDLLQVTRTTDQRLMRDRWFIFITKYKNLHLSKTLIDGAEIQETWNHLKPEQLPSVPPQPTTHVGRLTSGMVSGTAGLAVSPFNALLNQPKILEDDPDFNRHYDTLREQWYNERAKLLDTWNKDHPFTESPPPEHYWDREAFLEKNGKDSIAEVNFLYGNPDSQNPDERLSLTDRAKLAYQEELDRELAKKSKKGQRMLRRLEKYRRKEEETPEKDLSEKKLREKIQQDEIFARSSVRFDNHLAARIKAIYHNHLTLAPPEEKELPFEDFLNKNQPLVIQQIRKVTHGEWTRLQGIKKISGEDEKQFKTAFADHMVTSSRSYFPQVKEGEAIESLEELRQNFLPGEFISNLNPFQEGGNVLQSIGNVGKDIFDGLHAGLDGLEAGGNIIGDAVGNVIDGLTTAAENISSLFEGGAAGEAAALETALLPEEAAGGGGLLTILIAILPFLIFLFFIIGFIYLLWVLFSHPNYPVYVQVACSEEPGQLDAKGIGLAIASDFGISLEVNGNAATQLNNNTPNLPEIMAVEKRMYDDLCRLYGHAIGANGKPFQRTANGTSTLLGSDNTLGNLFRGFDHYYDSTGLGAGGHVTNLINLWIKPSDPTISKKTHCTAEFWPIGKSYDMDLWMYQPDQCLANQTDQTNLNVPDYAMEFLLDKYLGLKLIDRVQDELINHSNPGDPLSQYVKHYKVYDDFLSTVYKNGTSLLPNPECQTPGKDQPKNCFAVMIADYTTWGVYANFQLNACTVGGDAQKTADLASQLVNTIAKPVGSGGCGGIVNTGNYACLHQLNPSPNPGGTNVEDRLFLNTNQNGTLQCAGFTQAVAIGIGKPTGDGDAASYVGRTNADYDWIPNDGTKTIQAGDYPVWEKTACFGGTTCWPSCEHIAVVVQTFGTTSTLFRTAAANVHGNGDVVFWNYHTNDTWCILRGWMRLKNASSTGNTCPVGGGGNASARIKPINSGDPNQYPNQPKSWMYASCSGCAFAEVMNAYGKNLTCGDLLQYESDKGYWDPANGFHGWDVAGIKDIANNFGFTAVAGQGDLTLDQVIAIANGGKPVVVGLVDHILVVKGGDQNNVYLVDSLYGTFHTVTRSVFLNGGVNGDSRAHWDGTYAILTPK